MSLIKRMRKQNAIYWPPAPPDDFGRPAPGALVELVLTTIDSFNLIWSDGDTLTLGDGGNLGFADLEFDDAFRILWGDTVPVLWGEYFLLFDPALLGTLPPTGNFRVRWEDQIKEFMDAAGAVRMSDAVVYVPRLPDGRECQVGGYLWLGDREDLLNEADPRANGANEIKRVDKLPNLKANEFLRTCYL